MSKHTPGPWHYFRGFGSGYFYVESDIPGIGADKQMLIKIGKSEENAQLIASAPDLLKALKDLVARCDGEEGIQPDRSNMCTIEAHAAIKRAEGL